MKKILILFLLLTFIPFTKADALSEKLTVDMHYVVISAADDGSQLLKHMVNYTNTSDEEMKGETGVGKIELPAGALNLQVQDPSLGAKMEDNGFVITKSIEPKGTVVIPYSYQVPSGIPVKMTLDYDLNVMQVLVPEGAGSVEIEGASSVANAGLMQFEEKNFWLYNVEGIKAGKELKITYNKDIQPSQESVSGAGGDQPQSSGGEQETNSTVTRTAPEFHNPGHIRMWYQSPLRKFNPHILMIVLGLILLSGFGYYSYFRWKNRIQDRKLGADGEEQEFQQLLARQTAIMDKILELEDQHTNGEINEEEYTLKLDAFKHHLVKVKLELRKYID